MPTRGPITSIADAHRRARRRLPNAVYQACVGGRGAGAVIRRNIAAFEDILVESRVGDTPNDIDLRTRVFGLDLSMPLFLSPVGVQAIRPKAEAAAARAAAKAGVAFGISNFASQGIEDVIPHNRDTVAQLYWVGTKDDIVERLERYRSAGAVGLIVTLDWTFGPGVDWDAPSVPARIDLATMVKFAPDVSMHPQWLLAFLREGELPTLEVPNFATRARPKITFAEAMADWEKTPFPSWEDIAWVKQQWGNRPFMVKGILHSDDARRAVDVGADAISVSNHGGNNFDAEIASVSALPSVVKAVDGKIDILLDGGIRRGSDMVKAIALGAQAVMMGRGFLWPLAARGEAGVGEALEIFRTGIAQAMREVQARTVAEIRRGHVITAEELPVLTHTTTPVPALG